MDHESRNQAETGNSHNYAMKLPETFAWCVLILLVQAVIFYFTVKLFGVLMGDEVSQSAEGTGSDAEKLIDMARGSDSAWSGASLLDNGAFLGLFGTVSMLICCPLIYWIVSLYRGQNVRDYLGLRSTGWLTGIAWVLATLALGPIIGWLLTVIDVSNTDQFMADLEAGRKGEVWQTFFFYFGMGVAFPVVEEFLFRGFILRSARYSMLGRSGSVILTAAIFTALHDQYDIAGLLFIFCLGLLLGAARLQTGSLYVPIAMHVVNNLWAFTAVNLTR